MLTGQETVQRDWTSEADEERSFVEAAIYDPAKFAELYRRNVVRVYAFFWVRTRRRDQTEELTAQVFYRAVKGISTFQWRGIPFSAWLFQIARNVLADEMKRLGRESELVELSDDIVSPDPAIERRVALAQLVNRLPHDQREVIVMRFARDKSAREIASGLGRTTGAVKQLQLRALKQLRKQLSTNE